MIPGEKQPAVSHALQTAFGVNNYEDIHLLTGGLSSALAYKITVRNVPYLLKILRTELISNPVHEFTCMQAAAEAGIAPHIWYASVEDRILITDYVQARPLPKDMAARIVPILRTLHSLPNFPKVVNYLDAANGFVRRFQASNILPESATGELFRRYDRLVQVYPQEDHELVASHNDLKPQNMRFDGNRIWLVDWESAFLNDPYVDLAIAANFFVNDEAQEESYLNDYFGEQTGGQAGESAGSSAGEYRLARFFLMRQVVSMFYATLLLMEASRSGLSIDADMPTPGFKEFHQELVLDQINILDAGAKVQYGLVHLREALRNMRTPRFEESLARVSDFHAKK
jgi:hypothetical protein